LSYAVEVRERGFSLYAAGYSLDGIVKKLKAEREDCESINRKTITDWRDQENWVSRAADIRNKQRETADDERAREFSFVTGEIRMLIEDGFIGMRGLDPKSWEAAAFAQMKLVETYGKLTGQMGGGAKLTDRLKLTVTERFMRALRNVEAFKPLLTAETLEELSAKVLVELDRE